MLKTLQISCGHLGDAGSERGICLNLQRLDKLLVLENKACPREKVFLLESCLRVCVDRFVVCARRRRCHCFLILISCWLLHFCEVIKSSYGTESRSRRITAILASNTAAG